MIEILSGTWAAGETKTFHINGERLEILDAQYAVDVYLMDKSGAQMSIMKNSEASFFSQPREGFNSLQIYSAQAQFVRFFVGSGDAGTRRISSTVQVVDGNKARSISGGAFAWRCTSNATAAAASAQLWNPLGSGVRSVVDKMILTANVATDVSWGIGNAAIGIVGAQATQNLLGGSVAVSGAQPRTLSGANPTANYFGAAFLPASGLVTVKFERPVVLMPGYGLVVTCGVSTTYFLSGQIEFFEEVL